METPGLPAELELGKRRNDEECGRLSQDFVTD